MKIFKRHFNNVGLNPGAYEKLISLIQSETKHLQKDDNFDGVNFEIENKVYWTVSNKKFINVAQIFFDVEHITGVEKCAIIANLLSSKCFDKILLENFLISIKSNTLVIDEILYDLINTPEEDSITKIILDNCFFVYLSGDNINTTYKLRNALFTILYVYIIKEHVWSKHFTENSGYQRPL